MAIDILPMTADDFDDVMDFWRNHPGVGLGDSDDREGIAAYLARNPEMSLVVRDEGTVVAAVLCGHDGRRGTLYHLAVAPSHRRRGIGTALVGRCIESLTRSGIPKCNVLVYVDNIEAQKFWGLLGFKERSDLKFLQKRPR